MTGLSAAYYYTTKSEKLDVKLSAQTVWAVVGGSISLWIVMLVLFFFIIDQKYLHTFFSLTTMRQSVISDFRTADTDERRALVFKKSFHVWSSIEGEVRAWIHANFLKFEKEKPEWWTTKLINKIPEEVLSKEEINVLISNGRRNRRRSSLQIDAELLAVGGVGD